MTADIIVRNDGTIWMLRPVTDAARAWVAQNVNIEPYMAIGDGFAADWRCGRDIVDGAEDAGLIVEAA